MRENCGGGVLLICSLFLASCENFLNGAGIKNQIEEQIAYANATECVFVVKSDEAFGSFLSAGEKKCKVGYSTDLQFTVNKSSCVFCGLEAVSSLDPNVSRADCVDFTTSGENENTGTYKITVKILKYASDILIRPVCASYPAVLSFTPDTSDPKPANTPITITFNTVLDIEKIRGNVSIKINGEEKSTELFSEPVAREVSVNGENRTQIIIRPKPAALKNFIMGQKVSAIESKISLSEKIAVTAGDITLPLKQDEKSSFSVFYEPSVETDAPSLHDFSVTAPRYSYTSPTEPVISESEPLVLKTLGNLSNDEFFANRTKDTVYITGICNDGIGSGVRCVVVKEQLKKTLLGGDKGETPILTEYDAENAEFTSENGEIRFRITHKIKSEDGAVQLDVSVCDWCENSSVTQQLTVIKKSKAVINKRVFSDDQTELKLSNSPGNEPNVNAINENLKDVNIKLYAWESSGFEKYDIPFIYLYIRDNGDKVGFPASNIIGFCEYSKPNSDKKFESFNLSVETEYNKKYLNGNFTLDVDSVPGVELKAILCDDIGNSVEQSTSFIHPDNIRYTIVKLDASYMYVRLYDITGREFSGKLLRIDSNGGITFEDSSIDNNTNAYKLRKGYSYKMIPASGVLYTSPCSFTISENSQSGSISDTVELKNYPQTSSPVHLGKSPWYEHFEATVCIADDSWQKFDCIYTDWYFSYDEDYDDCNIFYKCFVNGETSCTMTISAEESGISLDELIATKVVVYGIKDGKISDVTEQAFTITEEYLIAIDGADPHVNYGKKNGEYISYFFYDDCVFGDAPSSGLKYAVFTVNGVEYTQNLTNSQPDDVFTMKFAVWDLFSDRDYCTVYWDLCDNNGNRVASQENLTLTTKTYGTKLYSTLSTTAETDGYNSWSSPSRTAPASASYVKSYYEGNSSSYDENSGAFSVPTYTYNGSDTCTGKYNLVLANGGSTDSVAVSSDAPVFVHTLITKKAYNECKNWSATEWETFKRHSGDKYMSFSGSDHTPQRYDIPMSEINEGECYVVIAHFADNTTQKSAVMQK